LLAGPQRRHDARVDDGSAKQSQTAHQAEIDAGCEGDDFFVNVDHCCAFYAEAADSSPGI